MVRTSIVAIALLVNAVALFCVFNPWMTYWRDQGTVVLVVEAIVIVVIGVPVFCYHFFYQHKPLRQSLEDTAYSIMDGLVGWV